MDNANPQSPTPLFIRRNQLKAIVGISSSQVDRLERAGLCPRRRRIAGGAAVGWLYSEWEEYLSKQSAVE